MSTPLFEYRLKLTREREAPQWREGRLGLTPHSRKQEVVRGYLARYGIRNFVETGTYLGEMVQAVSGDVDRVLSIELDDWLFRRAVRKFAGNPKVRIYHGDSAEILPGVLASLEGRALFWLDAHYSAGITARGMIDTPIVGEFEAILARSDTGHVLLVDDANSFTAAAGYPPVDDVLNLCRRLAPNYLSKIEDNIIQVWPSTA
jgi:23S rRNA A2030 N6-methylase RlmJ